MPREQIAQRPLKPRDSARLLAVGPELGDWSVRDLPSLLRRGDLLVANDTKVIPAQLSGSCDNRRISITLDQPCGDGNWRVLSRNGRRIKQGKELIFLRGELTAFVIECDSDGGMILRFNSQDGAFWSALDKIGALAIPPYIGRPTGPTEEDNEDYQTMFATHRGAVAAPTAGLHFTPGLLADLGQKGIGHAFVTLHVGAGTFLPVRNGDPLAHRMHSERGKITRETACRINETRARGGRIVAVGTTSLRLLEASAASDGTVAPFEGDITLFILPGFQFRVVDLLLTNFHLPRSTLFMLVSAFGGVARLRAAYDHAIRQEYRFYSYGDVSLLERAPSGI